MRWLVVGVFAPAAVTLLPAGVFAQDTGIISGRVTEGGRPRDGVSVVVTLVCDADEGRQREECGRSWGGTTGDDGTYSIGGLRSGTYRVRVEWPGPRPGCADVDDLPPVEVGSSSVQEYDIIVVDGCPIPSPPTIWFEGKVHWAGLRENCVTLPVRLRDRRGCVSGAMAV